MFIVFEGIDHAGKTTQAQMLRDYLEKEGQSTLLMRDPGTTPIGNKLRELLLDKDLNMSVKSEVLLFTAARGELAREIEQQIAAGYHIVLDRWLLSMLIYQGRGASIDWMLSLHQSVVPTLLPDVMFILQISAEEAFRRQAGLPPYLEGCSAPAATAAFRDRFESDHPEEWKRRAEQYDTLPQRIGPTLAKQVLQVPATYSIPILHKEIVAKLGLHPPSQEAAPHVTQARS